MRILAIGDIHGCLPALQSLDEHLQFSAADTVITLGDYIDRGPDSAGVINYLITLSQRTNLIPLRGNHEIMMLEARSNIRFLHPWLSNGGNTTLQSYRASSFNDIPAEHWDFISNTLPYHELGNDFFVHANADPDLPLSQQSEDLLYWKHLNQPKPHSSGRRMICGHTSQKSGRILDLDHTVCIDTWAFGEGWLTCLNVKTGQYWQTRNNGELQTGHLPTKPSRTIG